MSWAEIHKQSVDIAFTASQVRLYNRHDSEGLYRQAADFEVEAFNQIPLEKPRTRGIIGLSAASLLFKGAEYERAASLSMQLLSESLPADIQEQLQLVLQASWNEKSKKDGAVKFLPGQIIISLSGGEIIKGGAPLELVINKVQNIQSLFIRTIEYLSDSPFRTRGQTPIEIRDYCRPWLFYAPPSSYQFAVAVEAPKQSDFFKSSLNPQEITDKFLDIVYASTQSDQTQLELTVRREDYREAFVRLARSLAPNGKSYEKVRIYSFDNSKEINLTSDAKTYSSEHIERLTPPSSEARSEIIGTLRALDLDANWLEVEASGRRVRVTGLEDAVDDIIGPMVNHKVKVTFVGKGKGKKYIDIEEAD